MFEAISVIVVAFTSIVLGLFVLTRNPNAAQNRTFAAFAFIVCFWIGANYFSNHGSDAVKLFSNRFAYTAAMLSILGLLGFSLTFPRKRKFGSKERILLTLAPFFLLMSMTSLVVAAFKERPGTGVTDIEPGAAYLVYVAYIVALFASAVINMARSYKSSDSHTRVRLQFMGFGIATSFLWVITTSALVPFFTGNWVISKLGPLGLVVMIGAIAYAIIKHSLFDVRFVVARSVAYIGLLFTTALVFASVVIIIPASVIGADKPNIARQVYYTFSAIILAFAFQPLRKFFDRVTNSIFYRDAYDSQILLDDLNQVIVSTIDLNKMLKLTSDVIEKHLKTEFCVFGLKETDYEKQRIIGDAHKSFDYQDISYARKTTPGIDHKVIAADYLSEHDKELQDRMHKSDVAVLARLTPDISTEGIGYIVLGNKKSGNPYNTQDIRVLETIANSMVIAIDNALRFEEIQKFNITLEQKVEDATRKLRKANDKLVALDQTKDDFISMASHQLRTPLTSVKGYLSMVLEGDVGKVSPKQEKLLDQAFISSQRMVYLIADLLNVSRLRTGKFVIEASQVNLADVIEGEVEQLQETAAARKLKLIYQKPKDFPLLYVDETKIRQVIMNFIDNAIYYTPTGGKIEISLKEIGKSIEFTVKDNGIGVAKHEQHNLFSKFFRAGNARKARPDGTGLGLFMAKKVVVAQGGAVIFSSQEGKGSTFGFTFAKDRLSAPPKTPNPSN